MLIIWGSRLVGKVDELSDGPFVATRFGHLYYIPLIPMGSYLVTQDFGGGRFEGINIGWSWKSILAAYGRTLTMIVGACGVLFGAVGIVAQLEHFRLTTFLFSLFTLGAGIAAFVALYLSYRLSGPSAARKEYLRSLCSPLETALAGNPHVEPVPNAPTRPALPSQAERGGGYIFAQAADEVADHQILFSSGNIPAHKLENVYREVIPRHALAQPVRLLLDLTAFGSAKDAVVITDTHIFSKEFGERIELPLAHLVAVGPPEGTMKDRVLLQVFDGQRHGRIELPVAGKGAEIAHVLMSAIER